MFICVVDNSRVRFVLLQFLCYKLGSGTYGIDILHIYRSLMPSEVHVLYCLIMTSGG